MDNYARYSCHLFDSLGSLEFDGHHQSRSIFLVPERLKKPNVDAYMPRVVSIGPRFKGSNEDLLLMEDIKIRCMKHLFQRQKRYNRHNDNYETFESCYKALVKIDNVIRASYMAKISRNPFDIAEIMLVDGCFLLELLIAKGLDDELPEPEPDLDNFIFPSPAIQLIRDEDVLSDLTLLENQIPIRVIYLLFRTLFPGLTGYSNSEGETKINNLILFVLGYYCQDPVPDIRGDHILDIVNFFVNRDFDFDVIDYCSVHFPEATLINPIRDARLTTQQQQLKLNRCALRLLTTGVIIKARLPSECKEHSNRSVWKCLCGLLFKFGNSIFLVNERGKHLDLDYIHHEQELEGLNFYFKFEYGILEIKQLHITKTTKAKWCNLIAWEHLQTNLRSKTRGGSGNCKFTSAALMFNGLICSEDDVQLLKDRKIVVDHLKMSNRELMEYFHKVAFVVDHKLVASSSYTQMVGVINNYSKAFFIKRIWIMVWNSFTYRKEWRVRFLNRNYNFVATVVFVLAVVQTGYTVLPYYFRK